MVLKFRKVIAALLLNLKAWDYNFKDDFAGALLKIININPYCLVFYFEYK